MLKISQSRRGSIFIYLGKNSHLFNKLQTNRGQPFISFHDYRLPVKLEVFERYREMLVHRYITKWDYVAVFLPLTVIILAEALFFLAVESNNGGLYNSVVILHATNIMLCFLIPIISRVNDRIYFSYALISVLRICGIGMPSLFGETMVWIFLAYIPLAAVLWFGIMNRKLSPKLASGKSLSQGFIEIHRDILKGVPALLPIIFIAALFGSMIGIAMSVLFSMPALIADISPARLLSAFLILVILVATVEEILFRGMLQSNITDRFGAAVAIILSSILFGFMHSGMGSPGLIVFMSVVGIIIGAVYYLFGKLSLVVVIHGTALFMAFAICPFFL